MLAKTSVASTAHSTLSFHIKQCLEFFTNAAGSRHLLLQSGMQLGQRKWRPSTSTSRVAVGLGALHQHCLLCTAAEPQFSFFWQRPDRRACKVVQIGVLDRFCSTETTQPYSTMRRGDKTRCKQEKQNPIWRHGAMQDRSTQK
jgi:hypothetical protein